MKKIVLFIAGALLLLAAVFISRNYHPDIPVETLIEKYAYPEDSGFLEMDGMLVHYRSTGSGAPLVLLHGTGASLHTWEAWTKVLSASYRVISLDLPAFGLTGPHPDRDYSAEAYTRFLASFTRRLSLDTFYLAGNSLGGYIAWEYAVRYPEQVRKLILVDAAGIPRQADRKPPMVMRLARNKLLSGILTKITPKSIVRNSLLEVYGDDRKVTDALVNRYFELSLRAGNRQAFVDRSRLNPRNDAEQLRQLPMPVLVLWGEKDKWIPVADAQAFKDRIPQAKVIIYPGIGHLPMEEAAEASARDVAEFLK